MDITMGVPRIKEIINATANINTPIITVKIMRLEGEKLEDIERRGRKIKGEIEQTKLGEVLLYLFRFHHIYLKLLDQILVI